MLLDGQPTITHNTLLCVHPQKHSCVSSENHDSTSLALSCPVEQQSDKDECNMADKFHLFLIRASSVFLGVPCSSPLPGNYGRISSHLSGCAASAPESSPAPPASSSAAERNKRRSGDYTSVTEWVNKWMNGWVVRQWEERTSSSFSKMSLSVSVSMAASGRGKSASLTSRYFSRKLKPKKRKICVQSSQKTNPAHSESKNARGKCVQWTACILTPPTCVSSPAPPCASCSGCTGLCSFRSASHASRPSDPACASSPACSSAAGSQSEPGPPLANATTTCYRVRLFFSLFQGIKLIQNQGAKNR